MEVTPSKVQNTGSEKSKDHRGSGEEEQGRAKGAKRMHGPLIVNNWDKEETEESNGEKEETMEGAMGSREALVEKRRK